MMSAFDQAFEAWLARLASVGFAAAAHLHAPATPADIEAAERAIGYDFTDDLRALYARADGQHDLLAAAEDPSPGVIVAPLFGGYEFVPLAKAVRDYLRWADVLAAWDDGDDDQEDPSDPHAFVTRRGSDPVAAEYWRRGWFPFAIDGGGNAYAADFSPLPGGTYGQVILIGPDEDERRVLAPSVTVLLATAAERSISFTEALGGARWFVLESLLG